MGLIIDPWVNLGCSRLRVLFAESVDTDLDKPVGNHMVCQNGLEQYTVYLLYHIDVWWRSTKQFGMATV